MTFRSPALLASALALHLIAATAAVAQDDAATDGAADGATAADTSTGTVAEPTASAPAVTEPEGISDVRSANNGWLGLAGLLGLLGLARRSRGGGDGRSDPSARR